MAVVELSTIMNPDDIELKSTAKMFAYEGVKREIDSCDDIETLRTMFKCYVKMYFKQSESFHNIITGSASMEESMTPPPEFP